MITNSIAKSSPNDRGIALVMSLLLVMVTTLVGTALLFMARSETLSTSNYRLMSQARYGAESGLATVSNYLSYSYTPPAATGADPISAYIYDGVSPVTYNGQPVVLSANANVPSNYPVAAVQAAFLAANQGSMASGNMTVNYRPYATLMTMQQVTVFGGGLETIQTWLVRSEGSIGTLQTARVQVSALSESQATPTLSYAAFGTSGGCGALDFHGNNTQTDSYDSSMGLVSGSPALSSTGGNVGTNGNLTEGGGATIHGTLSTPRVGVGDCGTGNVSALTSSGGASVSGGVLQLPQAISLETPDLPSPLPPTTAYNGNNQTLLDGASVGNVTVNANKTLTLCAPSITCRVNVNSITLNGNSTLSVPVGAAVILNVVGTGQATPIDFTGGTVANASYDPSRLQIQYAGTGAVRLNGGSQTCAVVYAPNAAASLNGGGDFYGAIVAATVNDNGGATIHYDRRLASEYFTVGNTMLSSFNWQRY